MDIKHDISYGVVPLIYEAGVWYVFLIHQYGHGGDVYWTFPKGHPEEGETPVQSALRELKEETNLEVELLDTTRTYKQEYSFPYKNYMVEKKVLYYLGVSPSREYLIEETEVEDAGWFTFEEALDRLTHDRAKVMLQEVQRDIDEIYSQKTAVLP